MPSQLRERIQWLNEWAPDSEMRALIIDLCDWKAQRAEVLADLLGRKPRYLREQYLKPLVEQGVLQVLVARRRRQTERTYRTIRKEDPAAG